MPRDNLRHKYRKEPPEGFSKVEPTLLKFEGKFREAQNKPIQLNRPKHESTWEIHRLNHQRSRYIYELYYQKKMISKELYNWLLRNRFGDKELIAKWKKTGYEQLCCLKCIQTSDTNQNTTCICRVPKADLDKGNTEKSRTVQCVNCGCRGCASTD